MKLPKELTTVTPLSKYLAMVVFIALPFVGFFLGMRYQKILNLAKSQQMEQNLSIPRIPTLSPAEALAKEGNSKTIPTADPFITANWKTYRNKEFGFEVKYPEDFVVKENIKKLTGVIVGFGRPVDVLIGFPDSVYETSNLHHGALHINRILNPENNCVGFEYPWSPPTIKIINGISFTETSGGQGAMGLSEMEKRYNIIYRGICYQIEIAIDTEHYYKDLGGKGEEVDPREVEQKLDQILSTFKFTQ